LSSKEKTLKKWENKTDEKWNTVKAILESYGFIHKKTAVNGSHLTYVHPVLADIIKKVPASSDIHQAFAPNGQIIVIRHGNTVYSEVLKRILFSIEILEEDARIRQTYNDKTNN
jgi:predicted RNA binding protein YcfA (HicA-like mRNA interferase family)